MAHARAPVAKPSKRIANATDHRPDRGLDRFRQRRPALQYQSQVRVCSRCWSASGLRSPSEIRTAPEWPRSRPFCADRLPRWTASSPPAWFLVRRSCPTWFASWPDRPSFRLGQQLRQPRPFGGGEASDQLDHPIRPASCRECIRNAARSRRIVRISGVFAPGSSPAGAIPLAFEFMPPAEVRARQLHPLGSVTSAAPVPSHDPTLLSQLRQRATDLNTESLDLIARTLEAVRRSRAIIAACDDLRFASGARWPMPLLLPIENVGLTGLRSEPAPVTD